MAPGLRCAHPEWVDRGMLYPTHFPRNALETFTRAKNNPTGSAPCEDASVSCREVV